MYSIVSMKNASNQTVTEFYMQIIYEAAKRSSEAEMFTFEKLPSKDNIVIVSTIMEAVQLFLKGYKRVGIWMQGILPEESYMKHQSVIRKTILEVIEKFCLKRAEFLFMVSKSMLVHYERKYNINIKKKTFTMPCFNTCLHEETFDNIDRYSKKIFTYVGSLAEWQCFDETLDLYNLISKKIPNTELRIFTQDIKSAKEKCKRIEGKCIVKYVPNDRIHKEMQEITYGFILRKNHPVNKVATPTKLSTYMANGIIPIYSSCLTDFHNIIQGKKYAYVYSIENNFSNEIVRLCSEPINVERLKKEYYEVFDDYYNREKYIEEIAGFLEEKIKYKGKSIDNV